MSAAVLFDLDNTLVDHDGAVTRALAAWLAETAAAAGSAVGSAVPAAGAIAPAGGATAAGAVWAALEREHFDAYLAGQCSYAEQRRRRLRGFLPAMGLPVDEGRLDAQFEAYMRHYQAAWRLFPDVTATLAALRSRGAIVGVLTNGDRYQQRRKLTATGLDGAFDLVVTSDEIGAAKPDPRAFHSACALLDRDPGEVWYVGDRLDIDCVAADAAGLRGVWLNRHAARTAAPVAAPATVPAATPAKMPAPGPVRMIDRLTAVPTLLTGTGNPLTSVPTDQPIEPR